MSKTDFNRAALLLHIVESTTPAKWPKLRALHNEAMAELEAMCGAEPMAEPMAEADSTIDRRL